MCGIAGFVGSGDVDTLSRMIKTINHRGLDDGGVWLKDSVGLAHTRLSIIDLTDAGHQPMHSTDEAVSIVFNGEIYNYRELKKELEHKGRTFKSQSDTEVILELYAAHGEKSFEKLEGMFALGLYDKKIDALFLVRDRFGEKPLYWTQQRGTLVFASEPRALFQHPDVSKNINPAGVISYLTHDAVLTPESIFKGIHKLEAATYARYSKGKFTLHSYWSPPKKVDGEMTYENALERLDAALQKSVSRQMIADVPVGVFLSGGLDSSTIAYYAGLEQKEPVHTFSIGFKDSSYDESGYAYETARFLNTDHHERIVSAGEMLETLHAVIQKLDEPVADPAMLPTYLLSQFARKHVKVALGGEGSDELFAGYQTFTAGTFAHLYKRLPFFARKSVKRLVDTLPVSHSYFSFDFKARQFLRGADAENDVYMHQKWMESFNDDEKTELLAPEYRAMAEEHSYTRIDEYLAHMPEADRHVKDSYFYLRTYLQDVLLTKVDRMSMAHSLEVRAPFLDKNIAELALKMPWKFKYHRLTGKYILRQLMKERLPYSIVRREKHGFALPVGNWFKNEWRELLLDSLSQSRVRSAGFFSPQAVERLLKEHLDGTHNHRKKLWSLFMFQLWYDGFSART